MDLEACALLLLSTLHLKNKRMVNLKIFGTQWLKHLVVPNSSRGSRHLRTNILLVEEIVEVAVVAGVAEAAEGAVDEETAVAAQAEKSILNGVRCSAKHDCSF